MAVHIFTIPVVVWFRRSPGLWRRCVMPLLVQSLPLSIRTFGRYLLALPFLAIAAILISVIGGLFPLLNLLVPGTVSAFFIIIGLRCALAARGHDNVPDYSTLLRSSVVFCVLNIVAYHVIGTVIGLIAAALRASGLAGNAATGGLAIDLLWVMTLVLFAVAYAVYASAIAVPMTAAAAAGSRSGPDRSIFFGIGTGWFSLSVIMMVWLWVSNIFAIFGEVWLMFAMVLSSLLALLTGNEIPWSWSFDRTTLMGRTLFMTWASAWFYATAVLAWETADSARAKAYATSTVANRVSEDTLRALREERMRKP
jgi:hypothetical protein